VLQCRLVALVHDLVGEAGETELSQPLLGVRVVLHCDDDGLVGDAVDDAIVCAATSTRQGRTHVGADLGVRDGYERRVGDEAGCWVD